MRSSPSFLSLALILPAPLAVASGMAVPGLDTPDVQEQVGTIRATVDGEEMTWYVLEGTVDGKQEPSALWMENEDGSLTVIVGGYDRIDVPFDEFERDPSSGMVVSYGGYQGDVITLTFDLSAMADGPTTFRIGVDDASVLYVPSMDFSRMLSLESGSLTVESVDWGTGHFSGTFQGELREMDGSQTGRIENGSFEVDGAQALDEITSRR